MSPLALSEAHVARATRAVDVPLHDPRWHELTDADLQALAARGAKVVVNDLSQQAVDQAAGGESGDRGDQPGQALFGQDEPAGAVFNVIEGSLRLSRLLPDGRRQVMGFALPGDFLGLAPQERHSVSAEALAPVRTCRFERRDFARLVEAKPHLLMSLHERAGYELNLAQEQMLLLGRRTAEEKVAAITLDGENHHVTKTARIGRVAEDGLRMTELPDSRAGASLAVLR